MDFALARHNMVEGQIRTNRVTDTLVVAALEALPREDFVAEDRKTLAYIDEDQMVGAGRILMEPMVLARLMQAAAIEETDLALVIAAASGYEAAAISKIASAVVAIESDGDLQSAAVTRLAALGADTVTVLKGDLAKGHPGQGPYDVIFVNGAADEIPASLTDQLADGGRLVYVKTAPGTGKAMLVSKNDGVVSETVLFDASVPALPEFAVAQTFTL